MDTDLLLRLQNWHLINCDGDWEHAYGTSIQTTGNPGWAIKIDLFDTCLQGLGYEMKFDHGKLDWLTIQVNEKVFEAFGDTSKLTVILAIFLNDIIPNYTDRDFEYEVYVQLYGGPTRIWRPVKARLISDNTLQICRIPELAYSDIRTASYDDLKFEQEDIFKYQMNVSIDDNIQVELTDIFKKMTLIAKE